MDNTVCIILNYNDADTVLDLVEELKGSREIAHILVVDNRSTDGSWERLQRAYGSEAADGDRPGETSSGPSFPGTVPDVRLLRTERNGGYGYGNQAGISHAVRLWNPDYIIIANPDIHVADRCIRKVKTALKQTPGGAVGSAMVAAPDGRRLFSYWDLLPLGRDLLDMGPLTRRLLKPWLITPPGRLPAGGTEKSRIVGAVPGSFFVMDMKEFPGKEAAQVFDEAVFLYCEEKILGQKLRERGLKCVLVTDTQYVHAHSVTIDRNVAGIAAKQKILHESKLYYYRCYLKAGPLAMAAARIFLGAVYTEVWVLTRVFRMKW